MLIATDTKHLADTIKFDLQVQKTVVQDFLRIEVRVHALTNRKEADFAQVEKRIHAALQRFIPIEWKFRRVSRSADALGFERIELIAFGAITAADNYNLEERAHEASAEGLTLKDAVVNYSLPPAKVGEVLKELGEQTLELVTERIATYRRITGQNWRLGELEFNPPSEREYHNPKLAMMEDRSEGALVEAERVTLKSRVVLKAIPPVA